MLKNNKASLTVGAMAILGLVAGIAAMASAQSATVTAPTTAASVVTAQPVDTPEPGDTPDASSTEATEVHQYAPLGGDGVISSISGTSIVIGEEANEGGASYAVDASKATVSGKDGASLKVTDLKVGDKVFVVGNVSGTNVSATSISLGHPHENNDAETKDDGNDAQTSSN